jgi:DNA invertase Pin-like site-specific DNA recombinase
MCRTFGVLAEFERDLVVRERTRVGLAATRDRGRKGGRPRLLPLERRKPAVRLCHEQRYKVAEICRLMATSKPKLHGYLDEAGRWP